MGGLPRNRQGRRISRRGILGAGFGGVRGLSTIPGCLRYLMSPSTLTITCYSFVIKLMVLQAEVNSLHKQVEELSCSTCSTNLKRTRHLLGAWRRLGQCILGGLRYVPSRPDVSKGLRTATLGRPEKTLEI